MCVYVKISFCGCEAKREVIILINKCDVEISSFFSPWEVDGGDFFF